MLIIEPGINSTYIQRMTLSCPIVDSTEGVTHAFRSKEYNERNEQYKQIWDIVCKGQKNPLNDNGIVTKGQQLVLPNMFQFSRLEFVRTVLSKRKLAKLIERGVVEDWNDPRLPTIQGIMRRGMQTEALDQFVMDQAMSVVNTEPQTRQYLLHSSISALKTVY
eukprot:TRINITY_DN11343_c0_g1_i1.p1 TRINITY_DN11343_c0_g1~~TRINITY_DN11343_c0_g1_i1.p1  ORF type:complete len:163 (-),score=35.27 TRINITY_DN11343_c0_g1_i1:129-617(-)